VNDFLSFWDKNLQKKNEIKFLKLELVSNLEYDEIIKELTRTCKTLNIDWKRLNEEIVRCKFLIDSDHFVIFDITINNIVNGFVLQFNQNFGDTSNCTILFHFMKRELKLTKNF
jgi:hypothetical protein